MKWLVLFRLGIDSTLVPSFLDLADGDRLTWPATWSAPVSASLISEQELAQSLYGANIRSSSRFNLSGLTSRSLLVPFRHLGEPGLLSFDLSTHSLQHLKPVPCQL